jgi:hypothetical protein
MVNWIKHIKYLVPCRQGNTADGTNFELAVLITPSGDRYIAAFTRPAELDKWPYGNEKVGMLSFDELKLSILNNPKHLSGIVINPFSKMLLIRREQLEQFDLLTRGIKTQRVEQCGNLFLSHPEMNKPELVEELDSLFRNNEMVYKAFMLMAQEPTDTKPVLLFIVDFSGEKNDLFPTLAERINQHMNQGETFKMMKATYNLLRVAESISKPIYIKN